MARTAIRSRSPQSSPFSYNMAKTDQHSGPYRLQNEPEEDHIAQIFNCLQSSSTAAFQTIGSLDTKGNYEDDDSIEIHNVYLHHAQSKASTVVPNAPNSCHGPEDAPSNVRRHSNIASAAKYPIPAAAVTKYSHALIRHEDPHSIRSNPDCTLRRPCSSRGHPTCCDQSRQSCHRSRRRERRRSPARTALCPRPLFVGPRGRSCPRRAPPACARRRRR